MRLDPIQRRTLATAATGFLEDFHQALDERPLFGRSLEPDETERLAQPPPELGRPLADTLELLALADRPGMLNPSGGHLAYIPNGGSYAGAVAAFLAAGMNRYTGVEVVTPGFAQLEESVTSWMCDLFGMGERARGVLLSGGSMANFTAIVAARTAKLGSHFLDGTMYVSRHAHHSVVKAARLAGFPADAVRTVPVDSELRMSPGELQGMIDRDRESGKQPFLIVASAGTTDTGTVDPLDSIGAIARTEGLWFHADAAYGGFFQLTVRGREILAGIESADTITLDPHKGLSAPFGVGALLAADGMTLYEANHGKGTYLQDQPENPFDIANLSPELTRPFRGLQVWLPLQLHGVAAFAGKLNDALDLADHAYERLLSAEWVEKVWEPDLSVVAFQCHDDHLAQRAMESANATGKVALSSTEINGRYTLRIAILNQRTTRNHVDAAIDLLAAGYREPL